MPIQYKFFIVPAKNPEYAESDLNQFMRTVRVITTHREFTALGENSFWSLVVEYLSEGGANDSSNISNAINKKRIDYREVLSQSDFAIFAQLREWRKAVAAQENIPVYNVLTNEQMAKIIENRVLTLAALKDIDGVGDSRVKKYGGDIIKIITEAFAPQESQSRNTANDNQQTESVKQQ